MQGYENGFYLGGCLFDDVTKDMRIYKEEIFGPVLSVVRAATYDEALGLCNDHEYGNGVAIFTRDGDAARDFASKVQVGMVGVNVPIPVPVAYYTFGGWKRSGFGDLNQHGPDSIRFYTKTKTVTSRWPSGVKEGANSSFRRWGEAETTSAAVQPAIPAAMAACAKSASCPSSAIMRRMSADEFLVWAEAHGGAMGITARAHGPRYRRSASLMERSSIRAKAMTRARQDDRAGMIASTPALRRAVDASPARRRRR